MTSIGGSVEAYITKAIALREEWETTPKGTSRSESASIKKHFCQEHPEFDGLAEVVVNDKFNDSILPLQGTGLFSVVLYDSFFFLT